MGIPARKKECKGYGRESHHAYLFSHGLCKNCNNARILDERKELPIEQQAPFRKTYIKTTPSKKQVSRKKDEMESGRKYWESMANEKGEVHCEESGVYLGRSDEYNHACLAHILGNKGHQRFRTDPRCFILLTFVLHNVLDTVGDAEYKEKMLPNTWERIEEMRMLLNRESHT